MLKICKTNENGEKLKKKLAITTAMFYQNVQNFKQAFKVTANFKQRFWTYYLEILGQELLFQYV